jgi:polysaccharide export outer membrane protein
MLILFLFIALQAAPPAASDPRLYIVGPNDVLTITVFNQPQLSGKFAVEADGALTFPLVGRVTVGGKSIRAAEDEMRRLLSAGYLKDPQVSISVEQYRSQQVIMMGEVKQPGSLQFTGSMTLLEALARVGSTTERAGMEAIVIRPPAGSATPPTGLNPNSPNAETIRVDLASLQTGALAQNIVLRAGDTVFVPRAATVFVSGHVKTPGEYAIRTGMTVRQAIALAGGVTDRGSTRRLRILRQVDGKEVSLDVDLQALVQQGDTIVVRERFF